MGLIFKQLVMIMIITSLLQAGLRCHGCLDNEMRALMQLKPSFNSNELFDWRFNDSDCCDWSRVHCNDTTGTVTTINLGYVWDGTIMEDWYLNASLFLPFKHLEFLDLSGNNIISCVENHGFDKLSGLRDLELSDNKFTNSVLSSLNSLPHLETLSLGYNNLQGRINIRGLPSLIELDLSNVTQNGLQIVGASPSLQTIYLEGNTFKGPIFGECNLINIEELNMVDAFLDELAIKSLEYLPSLKRLNIAHLNDSLLTKGFIRGKNLEELVLWDSTIIFRSSLERIGKLNTLLSFTVKRSVLGGDFLSTAGLCSLSRLKSISLENIELKGTLPKCLANLTYLQSMYVDSEHIQIPGSFGPLMNNSNLIVLTIEDGQVYEDMQVQSLIPSFQLKEFSLSAYGSLSSFPRFLYHQRKLLYLSVENVQIGVEFPYWFLSNNSNLIMVALRNLSLGGSFQLAMQPLENLSFLDISSNRFHGYISSDFSTYLPKLTDLNLSSNYFTGSILPSVCNMNYLHIVDLSYNEFSAQIPSQFPSFSMTEVFLNNNKFQGFAKDSFLNPSNLVLLDLSRNSLTGNIPASIGRSSSISFLILRHNFLGGKIPIELCKWEQFNLLDLSYNNLSGHIPSCISMAFFTGKGFQFPMSGRISNRLHTLIITTKGISQAYSEEIFSLFYVIDLSCNNLFGEIPLEIGNLSCINSLNFSHNNLTGSIPSTLSKLRQITSLDLSHNKLQGNIPSDLTQLTSLSSFNVAYNNLSGKTPGISGQFVTFKPDSYEGNPYLCGFPLEKKCTSEGPPQLVEDGLKDDNRFIDMTAFYASLGASYIVIFWGMIAVLCINPNWRRAWFYLIETIINNVYYFLVDKLLFPFGFKVYQPLV